MPTEIHKKIVFDKDAGTVSLCGIPLPPLRLTDFPGLYESFLSGELAKTDDETLCLEDAGKYLLKQLEDNAFPKEQGEKAAMRFCERVTKWGGRTGGFVRCGVKKNEPNEVVGAIRLAGGLLSQGNAEGAIGEIVSLPGLGISYGSKILRMLAPEVAGVYDNKLNDRLELISDMNRENGPQKQKDFEAYACFCRKCGEIADALNDKQIANEARQKREKGDKWLVADVEAVLFFVCQKKE